MSQTPRQAVILEQAALVEEDELKFFSNFLVESSLNGISLRPGKDGLSEIETQYEISPLLKNNCTDVFCIQIYRPFNEIPPLVWKGLIGIEDLRFLEHPGFDFFGILRAFIKNIVTMSFSQGASTITQQLIKNTYFSNKKSITRKLKEIVAAAYIESIFEKDKIIELYLNNIVWGSANGIKLKGVYASAAYFFGKPLSSISSYEMAILISLLKGPYFYHPINHTDRLIERSNVVVKRLQELGLVANDELKIWNESEWKKYVQDLKKREESGYLHSIYRTLVDESEAINDYEKFVFNLSVFNLVKKLDPLWGRENIGIKAIIQKQSKDINWRYYSKFERKLENAIASEKHQIGSLLKPILYHFFVNNGLIWEEEFSTKPFEVKLKSGSWNPSEALKNLPEIVTLRDSLLWSLNRSTIKAAEKVGYPQLEIFLKGLVADILVPLSEYPSQLLGSVEMTMAGVFDLYEKFYKLECAQLSNNEEYLGPLYVLSDPNKNTLRNKKDPILSNLHFFAKTGTSNKGLDNWFVFNDGALRGVIWVGFEGNRSIEDKRTFGSSTSYDLFRQLIVRRGQRVGELDCSLMKEGN